MQAVVEGVEKDFAKRRSRIPGVDEGIIKYMNRAKTNRVGRPQLEHRTPVMEQRLIDLRLQSMSLHIPLSTTLCS